MGATDSKATLYTVALLILLIIHLTNKYINSKSQYNQELRSVSILLESKLGNFTGISDLRLYVRLWRDPAPNGIACDFTPK